MELGTKFRLCFKPFHHFVGENIGFKRAEPNSVNSVRFTNGVNGVAKGDADIVSVCGKINSDQYDFFVPLIGDFFNLVADNVERL